MKNESIVDIFNLAFDNGISIHLDGEKLKLKMDKEQTPEPKLIELIKSNKEEILVFLRSEFGNLDEVKQKISSIQPRDPDSELALPLSYAQERLWFIDKLGGSVHYHVSIVEQFDGNLDVPILKNALQDVINRHEILRTVIREKDSIVQQEVLSVEDWQMEYEELKVAHNSKQLDDFIFDYIQLPFDLSKDYPIRARLYEIGKEQYVLLLIVHHIVLDGWSQNILMNEIRAIYDARSKGQLPTLPNLPIQYADYAMWQRNELSGDVLEQKLTYWEKRLSGVAHLNLPLDFVRPAIQSTNGSFIEFELTTSESEALYKITKKEDITLFVLMLSTFKVLLSRYSGQTDICVTSPVANRGQKELENLLGFFINTIVLRSDLSHDPIFRDLLQEVKSMWLETYSYQDTPFEKVVERVVEDRDMSMNPLSQVVFVLQNAPRKIQPPNKSKEKKSSAIESNLVDVSGKEEYHKIAKFDLTVNAIEMEGTIRIVMEYCTDLFQRSTIEKMGRHFRNLLNSAALEPGLKLSELEMLGKAEKKQLLELNGPEIAFPDAITVVDLFDDQVLKTPMNTAVVFKEESITYTELDRRSNQIAHFLHQKGVRAESLVGICLDRSIEMVIGIMGILKAGGVYVPIDPDYPADRIAYILDDANAPFIISKESFGHLLENFERKLILLDRDSKIIDGFPQERLPISLLPSNAMYIIYTSGSTGQPKGVVIEHRNIVRLFKSDKSLYDFGSTDVWTLFHSFCFDFSVWEMYGALLFGGKLVVVPKETTKDPIEYSTLLQQEAVTILNQTPGSFYNLQNHYLDQYPESTIRFVIFGGEALDPKQLGRWKNQYPQCRLINMYGITETTVHATFKEILEVDIDLGISNIGNAIPTLNCYILDENRNLLPEGIGGEIYVSGAGLARGYLNRLALTDQRFIANPFIHDSTTHSKLYKTGDLGRWLPDGSIEYLGRKDDQVKIRGYRIELGEIESALQTCTFVRHGVVLAKEDKRKGKRLVAYIVPKGNYQKEKIQAYLKSKLPKFMIPSLLIDIAQLPLTSNGKLDKDALPDPDNSHLVNNDYLEPRDEVESKIVEIWKELLGVERVGIQDDFFELGGHSLLATRVVSAIRKDLDAELGTQDVFLSPTVMELAELIREKQLTDQPGRIKREGIIAIPVRPERIPLSYAQERLWFVDKLSGSVQYHMPYIQTFSTELSVDVLKQSLNQLVSRHEILRTVIHEKEGQTYQQIMKENSWELGLTDLDKNVSSAELQSLINNEIDSPFDLTRDYTLRARLFKVGSKGYVLVLVLHHIASDGWSSNILVNELFELYLSGINNKKPTLDPTTIQYADFAIWQRKNLTGKVLEEQIDYWKTKLQGVQPLQLPLDYKRPVLQSTKGSTIPFQIDQELTNKLHLLCQEKGVTIFMLLLTAFKVLLYRYSGQSDICIGTPFANRSIKELENLVGFFVNMVVLRTNLQGDPTFDESLEFVKQTSLDAYKYQDTPFEKVVDSIIEERDLSRNPLFQAVFVLQNAPSEIKLKNEDNKLSDMEAVMRSNAKVGVENGERSARYDLTLKAVEREEYLFFNFDYCTDLFKATTIDRMKDHFVILLQSIVQDTSGPIGSLSFLPESEKQKILYDFNSTASSYPADKTLVDLFQAQVQKTPDHIAVIYQEEKLTYRALDKRSELLADYLCASFEFKQDELIGLMMDRSLQPIIAILGILKTGCAYVPIDVDYPPSRKHFIIDDARLNIVITEAEYKDQFTELDVHVVPIELDFKEAIKGKEKPKKAPAKVSDLAFGLYTSGSTGKPKGCLIEHRSIVNHLSSQIKEFNIVEQDRILLVATIAFDASVEQIFMSLLTGAAVCVIDKETLLDAEALAQFIDEKHISHLHMVPSLLNNLPYQSFPSLKRVLAGGEICSPQLAQRWAKDGCVFYNKYGPTETTVSSLEYRYEEGQPIEGSLPVGSPVANTFVYILDHHHQLAPIGVYGEICIGGLGVGRSYLNRPELTKKRFIENPFRPGERIYRTGDVGKWLPSGQVKIAGRMDDQVKIRGQRVELGEIESVIQQFESIKKCVVTTQKDELGQKKLVAYIVGKDTLLKESLRAFLKERLPEYMIPSTFMELPAIPLNMNGKVDKKALPIPNVSDQEITDYVAPRNDIEEKLVLIWEDLLGLKKISIFDDFFLLGGHSLLAARMVASIRETFLLKIPLKAVFEFTTIGDLQKYIQLIKESELKKSTNNSEAFEL